MFDKNGDQKISESELYDVMNYLGLKTTPKEVKAMIQVVDKNRNGYVDYDEFIQMMTQTQVKPLNADEELQKTFNIFDIDGNGYISADEIKRTMENLGENLTDEEVNNMIKAADKNCMLFFSCLFQLCNIIILKNLFYFKGDGKIDIKEFSALLKGVGGFHL
jgi:calmodulin